MLHFNEKNLNDKINHIIINMEIYINSSSFNASWMIKTLHYYFFCLENINILIKAIYINLSCNYKTYGIVEFQEKNKHFGIFISCTSITSLSCSKNSFVIFYFIAYFHSLVINSMLSCLWVFQKYSIL